MLNDLTLDITTSGLASSGFLGFGFAADGWLVGREGAEKEKKELV